MKAIIKISFLFVSIAIITSCANAPEGEKAAIGDAVEAQTAINEMPTFEGSDEYMVITDQSAIRWTGSKPTGKHQGVLMIQEGKILVREGKIATGEFILDMNSIKNMDLPEDKQGKLEGHLKTGDFFETEQYPTGKFVILKVEPDTSMAGDYQKVMGNLTLKGITKSVTFPAKLTVNQNFVTATSPSFTIDRTQWGINFKSTTIGALADEAIHDEIGLTLTLVAKAGVEQ